MNPVVALAMPLRNVQGMDREALARGIAAKATSRAVAIAPGQAWTSILPYTFNLLWCGFLGRRAELGLTHFAMIHDDIRPQEDWLDVLMDELAANDADVVSAVVPIKDNRGLTSTAIDDTGDEWNPRRLTLAEVFDRDETFTDQKILVNTGLWVCRFDRPWCERVAFRQQDRVIHTPDGKFIPSTKPEDWDFTRQVRGRGGRVFATRRVAIEHERPEWHNRFPWGTWKADEDAAADRDRQVVALKKAV